MTEEVKTPVVPTGGTEPPAGKVPVVVATQGAKEPKEEPKRIRLTDSDEDIPPDAELIEMSAKTLKARLNGAKRSEVRTLFEQWGVKNADELKTRLARVKELEDAEETRKRAEMSATQKLEADLKQERKLREDSDRRALTVTENYVVDKQETRISKLASRYIDPDYVEEILPKFAVHLRKTYSEDELKGLKDEDIGKWFKDYSKLKPKIARERQKVTIPLTNGARSTDRATAGDGANKAGNSVRSFAPSEQNAMSRAEARQEAAKLGYRW